MAGGTTVSPGKTKPNSAFADPLYEENAKRARKRRGIGDLFRVRQSSKSATKSSQGLETKLSENLSLDRICAQEVDGESCWSIATEEQLNDRLKSRVDNLLYSHDYTLFQRDRNEVSVYYELFFLGKNLQSSRLVLIISCTSEEDKERITCLIKKHPRLPGFETIELLTFIGSPRTSVPMKPLTANASVASIDSETGATSIGRRVYGTVAPDGSLTIPATIWIGDNQQNRSRATLGGVLSTHDRGKCGLTVAHVTSTKSITQNGETDDSSNLSGIGTVVEVSADLDWALIEFDLGVSLRTNTKPPTALSLSPRPLKATAITVQTNRGPIKGTLSGSVTHICTGGSLTSITTHSVFLDQPIRAGDCGAWVIGPNNKLHGQIAFGHDGDHIAYAVPAEKIFGQIEEPRPVYLSTISTSSQKKVEREEKEKKQTGNSEYEHPFVSFAKGITKKSTNSQSNGSSKILDGGKEKSDTRKVANSSLLRSGHKPPKRQEKKTRPLLWACLVLTCWVLLGLLLYVTVACVERSIKGDVVTKRLDGFLAVILEAVDSLRSQIRKELTKRNPDLLDPVDKDTRNSEEPKAPAAKPVSRFSKFCKRFMRKPTNDTPSSPLTMEGIACKPSTDTPSSALAEKIARKMSTESVEEILSKDLRTSKDRTENFTTAGKFAYSDDNTDTALESNDESPNPFRAGEYIEEIYVERGRGPPPKDETGPKARGIGGRRNRNNRDRSYDRERAAASVAGERQRQRRQYERDEKDERAVRARRSYPHELAPPSPPPPPPPSSEVKSMAISDYTHERSRGPSPIIIREKTVRRSDERSYSSPTRSYRAYDLEDGSAEEIPRIVDSGDDGDSYYEIQRDQRP